MIWKRRITRCPGKIFKAYEDEGCIKKVQSDGNENLRRDASSDVVQYGHCSESSLSSSALVYLFNRVMDVHMKAQWSLVFVDYVQTR